MRVETLGLVWPGILVHLRLLSSIPESSHRIWTFSNFFIRVETSFVSFGRAREFERECCGQQKLLFFSACSYKKEIIIWRRIRGTKDNTKAEIYGLASGWFPDPLSFVSASNSRQTLITLSLSFGQLSIDSHEFSRVSPDVNSCQLPFRLARPFRSRIIATLISNKSELNPTAPTFRLEYNAYEFFVLRTRTSTSKPTAHA